MMLLVHETLVFSKFERDASCQKEGVVVDPLGLKGVTVKEFVLSSEGKALELKAIEEIKRNKDDKLHKRKAVLVDGEEIQPVDDISGSGHDAQVDKETLETFVVGLLHELEENAIVEDAIALLSFRVLDIGPVFTLVRQRAQAVGVSLTVKKLGEVILLHVSVVLDNLLVVLMVGDNIHVVVRGAAHQLKS